MSRHRLDRMLDSSSYLGWDQGQLEYAASLIEERLNGPCVLDPGNADQVEFLRELLHKISARLANMRRIHDLTSTRAMQVRPTYDGDVAISLSNSGPTVAIVPRAVDHAAALATYRHLGVEIQDGDSVARLLAAAPQMAAALRYIVTWTRDNTWDAFKANELAVEALRAAGVRVEDFLARPETASC